MQKFISVFLVFAFPVILMAQKGGLPFERFQHLSHDDTLPYSLLQPPRATSGQRYPLVIFLHGAGERGSDNVSNTKHAEILINRNTMGRYPAFVLVPQCPKNEMWSQMMTGKPFSSTPTKPMALLIELIDKVMQSYPIEPARVYVTGVSMGGYGTWDLLARFPDRFAAGVPVCGGADASIAQKISHIPLWVFHGNEDKIVPPERSREMVAALRQGGGLPGYTEYPGVGHPSWNQAYKDPYLVAWMFRQQKVKP